MFSNNHSHTWAGRLQPRDPCVQEVASDATWGALPLVYCFPLGSVVSASAQQAPRSPRAPFDRPQQSLKVPGWASRASCCLCSWPHGLQRCPQAALHTPPSHLPRSAGDPISDFCRRLQKPSPELAPDPCGEGRIMENPGGTALLLLDRK